MYSENIGGISWVDLTVNNASEIKDFYKTVIGFKSESLAVDDYEDYVMKSPLDSDTQVGICNAKGINNDLPPQWLVYFNVTDIEQSIKHCIALGGSIIRNKTDMGDYFMCVIKDPSGAVASLVATK